MQCYLVAASQHLPFKQANDYCQTFGGLLPSITNQAEQGKINSLPLTTFISRVRVHY